MVGAAIPSAGVGYSQVSVVQIPPADGPPRCVSWNDACWSTLWISTIERLYAAKTRRAIPKFRFQSDKEHTSRD